MEDNRTSKEEEKVYIRENIVEPAKRKRYYVGKFIAYLFLVAALGITIGSSYGFVRNYFSKKNKEDIKVTETETETSSEDSYIDESQLQALVESYAKEWIESEANIDTREEQLKQAYDSISSKIVTISGISQGSDEWFNDEVINKRQTFGILIDKTENEILFLANYEKIKGSSNILVEVLGEERTGKVKRTDTITGICCITVATTQFSTEELEKLEPILIANSFGIQEGDAVILAGSPMSYPQSIVYGNISYVNKDVSVIDGRYRILYTDRIAIDGGEGILLDESGQLVGWIHEDYKSNQLKGMTAAIGISDLQHIINQITKNELGAYLGVKGKDVTETIAKEKGLVVGVYVTEIIEESPAYLCGIQKGDVITKLGDATVKNLADLESILEKQKANETISIEIVRKGREESKVFTFSVTLGQR